MKRHRDFFANSKLPLHCISVQTDLRKKLAAATEVIGEKEEAIDELRADLADIRDILAAQQEELATRLDSNPASPEDTAGTA